MNFTLGNISLPLDKGRFVGRRVALLQFEHSLGQIRDLPAADLFEQIDLLFPHIFLVSGADGAGKSALLHQFESICRAEPEYEPTLVIVNAEGESARQSSLTVLQQLNDAFFQAGFEDEFDTLRSALSQREQIGLQVDEARRAYVTLLSAQPSAVIDAFRAHRLDVATFDDSLSGAGDLAGTSDPFVQHLRRGLTADDWELLVNPAMLGDLLIAAVNAIAKRDQPLVVMLDAGSHVRQLDWLRRWVLPQAGPYALWVLAGDFDAAQAEQMRDQFPEEVLARIPLEPLSRLNVSSYLRQNSPRPGTAPNQAFVSAIQEISGGAPIAVETLSQLHLASVDVKNVFDEFRANGIALPVRMRAFLELFTEVGLDAGEAEHHRLWLYCLALLGRFDGAVLGPMLSAAGRVTNPDTVRNELRQHYPFIFGVSDALVHPLVRSVLQSIFNSGDRPESFTRAAEAAADYFDQQRAEVGIDLDTARRYETTAYRHATRANVNALLWADPSGQQALPTLMRAFVEAVEFIPALARELVELGLAFPELNKGVADQLQAAQAILAYIAPGTIEAEEDTSFDQALRDMATQSQADAKEIAARLDAMEHAAKDWGFEPLQHTVLRLFRGRLFTSIGQPEAALAALSAAEKAAVGAPDVRGLVADAFAQLGWQQVLRGGWPMTNETAAKAFKQATGLDEYSGYHTLGQAVHRFAARDYETAQSEVRRSIDQSGERSYVLNWLGHINLALDNFGKATTAYQGAIELQSDSVDAHTGSGYVLLKLGHKQEARAAFERALEIDPVYQRAHKGLGDAHAAFGERDAALQAYTRAIELDGQYAVALKGLATLYLDFGQYEQAQAAFEQAVALGGLAEKTLAETHDGLGLTHFHQGRYAESVAAYKYAIELAPQQAVSHVGLGQVYLHLGRNAEAMAACQHGIEIDPRYPMGHYTLGDIYRAQQEPENAVASYQRAVELDPQFAPSYTGLGSLYAEMERYPDAIAAYQHAFELSGLNIYELALAHKGLGSVYESQGNQGEAVNSYQQALDLNALDDRNRAFVFSALGDLHRILNDYDVAIDAYEQAVEIGVLGGRELALVHSGLGTAHRVQNRPDEALVSYRLAMVLDPKYAYPHNGLGNIHYLRGEFEEAIKSYTRAIELEPDYSHPHNGLANVYADMAHHAEAIQNYQRAIEIGGVDDHELAIFYNGLGNGYADSGEREDAIEAYLQAIKLDPGYAFPHSGLGGTYADLGNNDAAYDSYQRAIERGGLGDRELAVVYNGLGNVLRAQERYQDAINNYQQAIVLHPKDPTPHTGMAIACRANGDYDAAFAAYQRVVELGGLSDHDLAVVYSGLGGIYSATERPGQAVNAFERAEKLNVLAGREHAIVLVDLGAARLALDQDAEALEAFEQAVEADNSYASAHSGLGAARRALQQFNEAQAAFKWSIELDADSAPAHEGLGAVQLALQQFDTAEESFQRAIELDGSNASAYGGLGAVHSVRGQRIAALAAFDRAIELNPHDPQHWSGRGQVLEADSKYRDAQAAYQHAIGLGRLSGAELARAYNGLGKVYRLSERPEDAIEAYQQAIILHPSYVVPHVGLGVIYLEQGRYEEAQAAFQRALKLGGLEPDEEARVYYHMGKAFTLLDNPREARAAYEQALATGPKLAAAHIALAGGYWRQGKDSPFQEEIDQARALISGTDEYELACLESLCGHVDKALDLLDNALEHKRTTVAWARRDPELAPIRDNPRFEAIVLEYSL